MVNGTVNGLMQKKVMDLSLLKMEMMYSYISHKSKKMDSKL